jgi:predicted transcriptional regulator of viral defense system
LDILVVLGQEAKMHPILDFAETAYIEAQNLMPLLSEYTNPRDFISRLVKKGDLIRLKNGFFVIADKIKKSPVPYAQIANLLYGPSYISFEWALSYYGMIPEGVYVITNAAATKSKSYRTPLGTFDYHFLSHARYAIGIDQKENFAGRSLKAGI